MRKLLIVAEMRALEKQVHLGEISYSRMIEIINDKADTLLSDKLLLAYCEIDELTKEKSLFIEKYTKSCNEVQKLEKVNDELTKEVERLRKGLPIIDEAGAIAVSVSSKVEPSLSAQEEAMFIAGFQECIKYLSNQITP